MACNISCLKKQQRYGFLITFVIKCRNSQTMTKQETEIEKNTTARKIGFWGRTAKVLLWACGLWATLLLALHLILSPAVLTRIVNKYAADYVDGNISFGSASASMFRHFPSLTLTFDDFSITYPADRFDASEQAGVQGHLLYHGCSDAADTLASFSRFSASVNIVPLIFGKIRIPHAELVKPRIFAHSYVNGQANWNLFMTDAEPDTENEEATPGQRMPDMVLGDISLTSHPHIVYTDCADTLFTMIDIKQVSLSGRLHTGKMHRGRFGLSIDSLIVAGRAGCDTVALGLERLHIHEHGKHLDVNAHARTLLATRSFGRMNIPVDIRASVGFPKDSVFAIRVQDMTAKIADIPFNAEADIRMHEGKTGVTGTMQIEKCMINDIICGFAKNFLPQAEHISTDASINFAAEIDGYYDHSSGKLPDISVKLSVPESSIQHRDFAKPLTIGLQASAATDTEGKINVAVDGIKASANGMELQAKAQAKDILGNDPLLYIDGNMSAIFDSLGTFIPDSMNVRAQGTLNAKLKGSARLSELDIYKFSNSGLTGSIEGKDIILQAPDDTVNIVISRMNIGIGPESRTSRKDSSKSFRLIALTGEIDTTDITYKKALTIKGHGIEFSAKNSAPEAGADTSAIGYLGGRLKAASLSVADATGARISMDGTNNSFHIFPKKDHPELPTLMLQSRNKRITLNTGINRAILTDASIRAKAAMNTVERKARRKAFMDSLSRAYPGVPKDSLFIILRSQMNSRPIPEWMKEEDFRKQDIDIRLDETFAKYFREWDVDGSIKVRTGILMTPYFPLRNILRGFDCGFNNNEVRIDSFKVMSGSSELAAKGKLTGLKRALLGNGRLKLDIDVNSGRMNAGELIGAYNAGMNFNPQTGKDMMEGTSNSEFLKMVTAETATSETETPLIVVPSNLNARNGIDASNVTYSGLDISEATAEIIMKERCVQILNTSATTNMGGIQFDGFYSTRTKEDLKTGFSLNMSDITAEKVIELLPAVDTIMPMLKSFKGLLNCELAATASLDTNMNVITPSINGVVRIGGKDLAISDNELFRTLAKKLMFKNKKEGHVQQMTVEGVIKDNVLEVFPFVLDMDRYTLAMSGIQNLDMSFKYHVSVLKSPFLFRLGIDLYGQDFDHLKFRIGKAKYKNTNVPVFSAVIDKTKINLVTSIKGIFEKGVEAAVTANERQDDIVRHKQKIGYVNAAEQEMEELSEDERKQVEEQEKADEAEEAGQSEMTGLPEGAELPERAEETDAIGDTDTTEK